MLMIGPYQLPNPVVLAPMAGVTDLPFRQLCRRLGAGLVVGEMVSSNPKLRNTRKSQLRLNHDGEPEPIAVQIAGGDPESMAAAAKFNVENGAQIIDINMGCPAKKVCNKAAGSALMKDEVLVSEILHAVVAAVDVPVSLKMRTGWAPEHKNAPKIAEIAEQAGIVSLAVHGRTRDCGYSGEVEYHTIRDIKQQVSIPVFANGDITSAIKAAEVMDFTGADGVLIGRAAQGQPWIFKQVAHYLATGELISAPDWCEVEAILLEHIAGLYIFYGDYLGVRIARKHVSWYLQTHSEGLAFRKNFNRLESSAEQIQAIRTFFKDKILNKGIAA
ncbi:MAG: tRNA-dihydrouridine synthase B [Oleispira sp.]|jgi:tRNA-dihydrouridine synthase B